ncbi:DUF3017 domain-containing protein [Streptosporangium sp. NPDC023963]|uniref:DUF3017 domain-containing protein n=1 Tax=Streptosporangium sp. NPDC023963 TaxID=3155608 RepID=UPI003421B973
MSARAAEVNRERWGAYPLVVGGALVALVLAVLLGMPYWGGIAMGAVMTLGALARLFGGGRLAVRRKATDVVTLGGLGVVLMVAGIILEFKDHIPM